MPRAGRAAAITRAAAWSKAVAALTVRVLVLAALFVPPAAARQPQQRIANGAVNTSIPAVVRLDVLHDQKGQPGVYISERCSGTLVAPGAVLTAAHCFSDAIGSSFAVRVSFPAAAVGEVYACSAVIHPQFQGAGSGAFDYALLFLQAPVVGVAAVTLDSAGAGEAQGTKALGFGFGSTTINPLGSDSPQSLAVTVQAPQACNLNTSAAVQQICVASSDTGSAFMCEGDSGGPLLTWANGSSSPRLSGVISQATGVVSNCNLGQATSLTTCGRASSTATWVSGLLAVPPSAAALSSCIPYLQANNYFRPGLLSGAGLSGGVIAAIAVLGVCGCPMLLCFAQIAVLRRKQVAEALAKGEPVPPWFKPSTPEPAQIPPTMLDEPPPSWQRSQPAAAWPAAEEQQKLPQMQPGSAPRSLPALGRRMRVRRLRRDGIMPDDPAAAAYPGARGQVVGHDPYGRALVALQLDVPAGEIIWIGARWLKGMDEADDA